MTLYIGMRSPASDQDTSSINDAIRFMAAHVAIEKRHGRIPDTGPRLDITFMLPGKKDLPPFDGMRMGGYSDDGQTLFFEAAVPEEIVSSPRAQEYVAAVLHDVVDNAIEFFDQGGVSFDAAHWTQAIAHITQFEQTTQH